MEIAEAVFTALFIFIVDKLQELKTYSFKVHSGGLLSVAAQPK
jgi:hypothetical protein